MHPPHLQHRDLSHVSKANQQARFVFALFQLSVKHTTPMVIESPASSWPWQTPHAQCLFKCFGSVTCDMCAWDSPLQEACDPVVL